MGQDTENLNAQPHQLGTRGIRRVLWRSVWHADLTPLRCNLEHLAQRFGRHTPHLEGADLPADTGGRHHGAPASACSRGPCKFHNVSYSPTGTRGCATHRRDGFRHDGLEGCESLGLSHVGQQVDHRPAVDVLVLGSIRVPVLQRLHHCWRIFGQCAERGLVAGLCPRPGCGHRRERSGDLSLWRVGFAIGGVRGRRVHGEAIVGGSGSI